MRDYQHLTREQRYQISALFESKISMRSIAKQLGCSVSTISREIKRNSQHYVYKCIKRTIVEYRPQVAHKKYLTRRHSNSIISADVWAMVVHYLQEYYSPDQISHVLEMNHGMQVSHERIYRYIAANPVYKKYLRHKRRRKYRSRGSSKVRIKDRVMIAERPAVVSERSRLGDWELDTVMGLKSNQQYFLVTLVERKSRYSEIVLNYGKDGETVANSVINALHSHVVHTVTADNGSEFAKHKMVSEQFYFCDPCCSWQRGTNENTNGLIRQFFPKGTDFEKVTAEDVAHVQDLLNNRPRKCLGYKTPAQIMFQDRCCTSS
ncbi:MAG: IS30 family transposase [Deferribacteraceae bacterium]|jgi:IS30 family transposase|nr:IS30 family transposase [Deferribacteraceae bacterium]